MKTFRYQKEVTSPERLKVPSGCRASVVTSSGGVLDLLEGEVLPFDTQNLAEGCQKLTHNWEKRELHLQLLHHGEQVCLLGTSQAFLAQENPVTSFSFESHDGPKLESGIPALDQWLGGGVPEGLLSCWFFREEEPSLALEESLVSGILDRKDPLVHIDFTARRDSAYVPENGSIIYPDSLQDGLQMAITAINEGAKTVLLDRVTRAYVEGAQNPQDQSRLYREILDKIGNYLGEQAHKHQVNVILLEAFGLGRNRLDRTWPLEKYCDLMVSISKEPEETMFCIDKCRFERPTEGWVS